MADTAIQTSFEACEGRDGKLKDALMSLINISNENESRLKELKGEHDSLRQANDTHASKMAEENEFRKKEFSALDDKQKADAQARVTDLAKCDGKVDTEFKNRKEEVEGIKGWNNGENETRKVEIAELGKDLPKENEARKEAIDKLEAFVKSASVSAVGDLDARILAEANARGTEDKALSDRIYGIASQRQEKMAALTSRTDKQNEDRVADIDGLRTRLAADSAYMEALASKTMGVFFSAYRTGAYSGGGENLTFNGAYCNSGNGLDVDTGVFTCPIGGTYMFQFHLATHDNKKALLSIRVNDTEIASVFDQNHKDNHKNSMAGTNVVHNVKRGDKVTLYAYTGTWLADFPANHYTHFVGLLLQPNQEEMDLMMKEAQKAVAA
jgi:hypothetical protein